MRERAGSAPTWHVHFFNATVECEIDSELKIKHTMKLGLRRNENKQIWNVHYKWIIFDDCRSPTVACTVFHWIWKTEQVSKEKWMTQKKPLTSSHWWIIWKVVSVSAAWPVSIKSKYSHSICVHGDDDNLNVLLAFAIWLYNCFSDYGYYCQL